MCGKGFLNFIWFFLLWFCLSVGVLQTQEEPTERTQHSLQSSGSKSNGYEASSPIWDNLVGSLRTELRGLRMELIEARNDLIIASADATQSKTLSTQWMNMYEASMRRIDSLEIYNEQISDRMQNKDEEIYSLYQELDEQDKKILRKNSTILKMTIAIILLSLIIGAAVVLKVLKTYGKLKIPLL